MTGFLRAALLLIGAVATATPGARAEEPPDARHEVTLDMDRDGRPDRAMLVEDTDGSADLSIYLAAGDGKLDLSRAPSVVKKDLTSGLILGFESRGKGSLVLVFGCGGCSNDNETTLTIVYRRGDFLVAGYRLAWDTRYSMGDCDINYLAGKGSLSRDQGRRKALKGRFAPVKLADWSAETRPEACDS